MHDELGVNAPQCRPPVAPNLNPDAATVRSLLHWAARAFDLVLARSPLFGPSHFYTSLCHRLEIVVRRSGLVAPSVCQNTNGIAT